MKAGILTFHSADSYGAVLQARALVEVLRSLGHDASVIDYAPAYLTRPYRLWRNDWWKHPVGTAKNLANSLAVARRRRGFQAFREGMHLTPFPPEGFDAVVFGSDQVWNRHLNGGELLWFAQDPVFDHTRNIAYAASTGSVPLPEGVDFGRFHRLSVREPRLQAELAARGFASTLVLDPVLLAGKEVLDALADPCPVKGRYVVAYEVIDNPQVMQIASSFGLPVVRIASNPRLVLVAGPLGSEPPRIAVVGVLGLGGRLPLVRPQEIPLPVLHRPPVGADAVHVVQPHAEPPDPGEEFYRCLVHFISSHVSYPLMPSQAYTL